MQRLWPALVTVVLLAGAARAETAIDVNPSCREVAAGSRSGDSRIKFGPSGWFCWGSFAVIQRFGTYTKTPNPNDQTLDMCTGESTSHASS
jgi:hypothetical protein